VETIGELLTGGLAWVGSVAMRRRIRMEANRRTTAGS
jgi:hypothetical protein